MVSLGNQIIRLSAFVGTNQVTTWESEFIDSVYEKSKKGIETRNLSSKQVEIVERIFRKVFAD